MPPPVGPWFDAVADPDFFDHFELRSGQIVEVQCSDDAGDEQGTMLLAVTSTATASARGRWLEAVYIAASDEYYDWYMRESADKPPSPAWYHLCRGEAATCQSVKAGADYALHFARVRAVPRAALATGAIGWAGRGVAAERVEEYLGNLDGGRREAYPPGGVPAGGDRGEFFDAELVEQPRQQRQPEGAVVVLPGAALLEVGTLTKLEAPSSANGSKQLQLVSYSQRHPGRLAARLLLKMAVGVSREGGAVYAQLGSPGDLNQTPPAATSYILTVMVPTLATRMALCDRRELRTLSLILALLATQRPEEAADVVAQRIKAIDKALHDGAWTHAQLLELIPEEGAPLLERDEAVAVAREARTDQEIVGVQPWRRGHDENAASQKGKKGGGKTKSGKGGKGKPPEPAASFEPTSGSEPRGGLESPERPMLAIYREGSLPRPSPPPRKGHMTRESWRADLEVALASRPGLFDAFIWLDAHWDELATPLGDLPRSLGRAAPPSARGSRGASQDILPIAVEAVRELSAEKVLGHGLEEASLGRWSGGLRQRVCCILSALNFHYLGAGAEPPRKGPALRLSQPQLRLVRHVAMAVVAFVSNQPDAAGQAPSLKALRKKLTTLPVDYGASGLVVKMEALTPRRVIPAWPAAGSAAIQPVTKFLEGEVLEKVMDPSSNLLDRAFWPAATRKSYVRASDGAWADLVAAAFQRGIMKPVREEDVFRGVDGQPVYNGAGGVEKIKYKDGVRQELLRFISIFCPISDYLTRIAGGDDKLPYVGQVTLLHLEEGEEVLIDSEDFESCFNLFTLPDSWLGYFSYEKVVPGSAMGLPEKEWVRPALCVVPMGWNSAVAIMQSVVRRLVFGLARVSPATEVPKGRDLPPQDDLSILYLDSHDRLRVVDRALAEAQMGEETDEHARFVNVRSELGPPLNTGKSLIGATAASLQGGFLDSSRGTFGLQPSKGADLVWLGLALLAQPRWSVRALRHWAGKACFASVFRRPLYAVLQEVFWQTKLLEAGAAVPKDDAFDEVLSFTIFVPLAFANMRAALDGIVSCSDASLTGGGVAVAMSFRPFVTGGSACQPSYRQSGESPIRAPCGAQIGDPRSAADHRENCGKCGRCPCFAERFSCPRAPLTQAVAQWGIPVQRPFDDAMGRDFFSQEGKKILTTAQAETAFAWEHFAPEWRFLSTSPWPGQVRNARRIMGIPGLPRTLAFEVRRSSAMCKKALACALERHGQGKYWCIENPCDSWLWDFAQAKELEEKEGVFYSELSYCCFGGARRATCFAHNCRELHAMLHRDGPCSCTAVPPKDPRHFYECPGALCQRYAEVVAGVLSRPAAPPREVDPARREEALRARLARAGKMFVEKGVSERVVASVRELEATTVPGQEIEHLKLMLRKCDHRGTDVRLIVDDPFHSSPARAPCPALECEWKTVLSWRWQHEQRINILEARAAVTWLRRRANSIMYHSRRYLHILDSLVVTGVLTKGLLVGFTAFLRTTELLSLEKRHVRLFPESNTVFIALESTKTAGRKRAREAVHFVDRVILTLLQRAMCDLSDDDPLVRQRGGAFSRAFQALLKFTRLEHVGFQPYSLRRGGASWYFTKVQSMDATIVRGRWQNPRTARIYIEDSTAALVLLQLPAESAEIVRCLCRPASLGSGSEACEGAICSTASPASYHHFGEGCEAGLARQRLRGLTQSVCLAAPRCKTLLVQRAWKRRLDYGAEGRLRIVYESATPRQPSGRPAVVPQEAPVLDCGMRPPLARNVVYRGEDVFHEKPVFICNLLLGALQMFTIFLLVHDIDPNADPVTEVPSSPWKRTTWSVNCMKWIQVTFMATALASEVSQAMQLFTLAVVMDAESFLVHRAFLMLMAAGQYVVTLWVLFGGVAVVLSFQAVPDILYSSMAIVFVNSIDDLMYQFVESRSSTSTPTSSSPTAFHRPPGRSTTNGCSSGCRPWAR
ncbi:unnamed protein product [Prorocentrum cordatum]|uniref:Uncharacterized protein n=1 Tax=Prorocentrum cordatum TaxID=2364126 RepID=A0ABN9VT78_9DINO|nr:unnamed protein product [Polarella glacialis]